MTELLPRLLGQPEWVILTIAGLVVFGECAVLAGMVLPGETVAVLAGAAAALGRTSLAAVLVVVLLAAVVGDNTGYLVGRRVGPGLHSRVRHRGRRARLESAEHALVERGGVAVFVGRWTPFVRSVMPSLAGVSRMPWPRFAGWDVLGAGSWSVVSVLAGYAAGKSYERVVEWFGTAGVVLLAVVLVAGVAVWLRRRRAAQRA